VASRSTKSVVRKLTIQLLRRALIEAGSPITLAQESSVGVKFIKGMTTAGLKVSVRLLNEFWMAQRNGVNTQIEEMTSAV
jgi:hypothetical protein